MPGPAHGRLGAAGGRDHLDALGAPRAAIAPTHAAGVPGPPRLAQPDHDPRGGGRPPLEDPSRGEYSGRAPGPGLGGARAGRPRTGGALPGQAPERALRRPAPARRHRPGDHSRARAGGGGRAGVDARHERAGQGAPALGGPQAGPRPHLPVRHPRPRHGALFLRPGRHHVPRSHSRDRFDGRPLPQPPPPVHPRLAGGDPRARPRAPHTAPPAEGRGP